MLITIYTIWYACTRAWVLTDLWQDINKPLRRWETPWSREEKAAAVAVTLSPILGDLLSLGHMIHEYRKQFRAESFLLVGEELSKHRK